ncbi:hypothetical protein BDZ91DRAFT_730627 [Kalaharituber pfeilii]|nr:hypothetical protein BDZ91DRAFT_730627 [Kalaharituber pfeilii]
MVRNHVRGRALPPRLTGRPRSALLSSRGRKRSNAGAAAAELRSCCPRLTHCSIGIWGVKRSRYLLDSTLQLWIWIFCPMLHTVTQCFSLCTHECAAAVAG